MDGDDNIFLQYFGCSFYGPYLLFVCDFFIGVGFSVFSSSAGEGIFAWKFEPTDDSSIVSYSQ